MNAPFIQLKLSQKGLGLVACLLVMELVFVGWLYALLMQTEQYANTLAHSKAIISRKDRLLQLMAEASNAVTWGSVKAALEGPEYQQALKETPKLLDELGQLLKDQPKRLEVLADARALFDKEVETIDKMKSRLIAIEDNGEQLSLDELARLHRLKRKAEHSRDAIIRLLFDLDAPERKLEQELPTLEAKSRQSVRNTLILAATFNIILAVALGLAFVRNITRRIEVLVDNTHRVARKQPLNPEMGGTDEIAHLDRTLHAMEKALREAEERDIEIQKLKEQFVAMASHELRSPLTSIQGALTMLSMGIFGELPPEAASRVRRAESNVGRLINLINDLLDTEKMKAGKLDIAIEKVDVSEVIMKSVAAVTDLAEGKKVEIVGVEPDVIVEADKARIVQVLVNLLSNAIKYSPQNGRVDIDVDEDDEHSITVTVRDQGCGIAPDHVALVFERFEQVKSPDASARGGSGLGLAIAKQIIAQHGGTIGVDSEEGKGSEFWFRIPRQQPKPLQQEEAPHIVPITDRASA